MTRARRWRPARRSVRLRLTFWYASMIFVSGALLLTVSYFVVREAFQPEPERVARELKRGGRDRVPNPPPAGTSIPVEPPPSPQATLLISTQAELNRRALDQVLWVFVALLSAVTVGSLAAGWLIAGRALRPVAAITAAARRVSEENLGERIALEGPRDELRELADTFDEMLARLDRAFESQRHFVASASHELRTPLSVIQTALDLSLDDEVPLDEADLRAMSRTARQAVERAEDLIAALLTLAHGERGLERREPARLDELCRQVLGERRAAAGAAGVSVHTDVDAAAIVRGDPLLLRHMLANLVDNAIRHNARGGWLRVRLVAPADGRLTVEVANGGEVIPPAELEGLTRPFRRLGKQPGAPGFGLGLSIVAAVARAHDGELRLQAPPEGGLVATVELPAERP